MKVITPPYKYFGQQCPNCGAYFTYDWAEAAVGICCPVCGRPFVHSVDDERVDVEPDAKELKKQRSVRGIGAGSVVFPEFDVGQQVHVVYQDLFDLEDGHPVWKYFGTAVVTEVHCTLAREEESYSYNLDTVVARLPGGQAISSTESGLVVLGATKHSVSLTSKLTGERRSEYFAALAEEEGEQEEPEE